MRPLIFLPLLAVCAFTSWTSFAADAPTMVGYRGDGSCVAKDAKPPTTWDMATGKNILWKVPAANYGCAMPVVAGGRVYVMSEPGWKHDWPVLQCFDADTGKELWLREVNHLEVAVPDKAAREAAAKDMADFHAYYRALYRAVFLWNTGTDESKAQARAQLEPYGLKIPDATGAWREYAAGVVSKNPENAAAMRKLEVRWQALAKQTGFVGETWRHGLGGGLMAVGHAYATPVTDGKCVWVATASGAFACYDRDGNLKWMKQYPGKAGEFCRNGRSPLLYKDLLISDMTSVVRAIDRETGALKWSAPVDDGTIMTPAIITVGETDVLLCYNKKAFRLPDGKPLTVEGGSDFGHTTLVKTDEPDVSFSCGVGEHCGWTGKGAAPVMSPAVTRWTLEGDKLVGKVLWHGVDGRPRAAHASTYYDGKVYMGGVILDALTGKVLGGNTSDRRGVTAPSTQFLWIANGLQYGMEAGGACTVLTLDGRSVGASRLVPAPVEGEKLLQISSQDSPRFRDLKVPAWQNLSYGGTFMIAGDRIYMRTADYLVCVGNAARGSAQDDPAALAAIAKATDGAALKPYLINTGGGVRYAAAKRLVALPTPALRDPLLELLRTDPQAEIRAVAAQALDAIDPATKPGSTEMRAIAVKASIDAREWYKPGKTDLWTLTLEAMPELGAGVDAVALPMLADKDDLIRRAGVELLTAAGVTPSDAARDALIRVVSSPGERSRPVAAALLAARCRDAAPVQAAFLAIISDASAQDDARIAFEALLAAKKGDERAAFILSVVRNTKNGTALKLAVAQAMVEKPAVAGVQEALIVRANGKELPWIIPAGATGLLGQTESRDGAVTALKAIAATNDMWTARPAADSLLAMQAGGEAEAIAALGRLLGDAKNPNNNALADILVARAPALKDAARRAEAVALLRRMLALDNPDLQRRACLGLGAMGADAKPALEALKALTNHANAGLKQAATDAVAKVGG